MMPTPRRLRSADEDLAKFDTRRYRRRILVPILVAWLLFSAWVQPGAPSAFYTPPDELPGGPAGTIIRDDVIRDVGAGQQAWRVLYTSTDPEGAPIAVSGVVVAPDGRPPEGGWPVVAWAHGTTGVDRRCAPSIDYPESGLVRVPELDELVAAGTVVAITDYPGLGTPGPHPYLVGESEGRAVLDSIRAARALLGTDAVSSTAAIYGHSQGGHASVWADQIAGSYAPELDVAGVAAMAPPTDLGTLLDDDVKEADGIVLAALAISSWSEYYPDADEAAIVEPVARPVVDDIGGKCIATAAQGFTDVPDVLALEVTFLSQDPATAPGWSDRLRENSPGRCLDDDPAARRPGRERHARATRCDVRVRAGAVRGRSVDRVRDVSAHRTLRRAHGGGTDGARLAAGPAARRTDGLRLHRSGKASDE